MQRVNREPISFQDLLRLPGVEEEVQLRGKFGFCAFHGGNLERRTEHIGREAAIRANASFYAVVQPSGTRRHIPSKLVSPEQSAKLRSFINHCEVVVSLHGYGIRGRWIDLLIGGGNRNLARHVSHHLQQAIPAYRCIDDLAAIPPHLRGVHPNNPVNLPEGGGVQIELPPRVRGLTPLAKFWPANHLGSAQFPHMNHLIEGLAQAAATWPSARARQR